MFKNPLIHLITLFVLLYCINPEIFSQNKNILSSGIISGIGVTIPVETPSFSRFDNNSDKSLVRFVAGYSDNIISFDPFVIYYDENATLRFDDQLDARKLYNTDAAVTNFYLFDLDGIKLSIKALPFTGESSCSLRLGLKTERNGDVIFRISEITGIYLDKIIELSDLITGISINLNPTKEYKVWLPAGDYQNRFFLNLSGTLTDITEVAFTGDLWFRAYSSAHVLKTEISLPSGKSGNLEICNINGQVLFNQKINGSGYYEYLPQINEGIYIIKFISGNRTISKKILFKN